MTEETRFFDNVICRQCAKAAKLRCPKCKVPYCSKECQKKDWKDKHSKDCALIAADAAQKKVDAAQIVPRDKKLKLESLLADDPKAMKEMKLGDEKGKQQNFGGGSR
ncbi:hypothetical protein M885DRAFT_571348 [Pelagophyceae sp. CCMP2097]|nr:hypothetical protein M885DRAFT_571348 [Pelagophyceae sp. CCMP2097]